LRRQRHSGSAAQRVSAFSCSKGRADPIGAAFFIAPQRYAQDAVAAHPVNSTTIY
jgi:hypothetical protein